MTSSLRHAHHVRIVGLAALSLLLFGAITTRLLHLSLWRHEHFTRRAEIGQLKRVMEMPRRGSILDREGRLLAASVLRETLVVNTLATSQDLQDQVAEICSEIFGQPASVYRARLESGARYVPLVRRIDPQRAERLHDRIADLKLSSNDLIYFDPETKRMYPMDSLAAAVIGFTRPDDTGDNDGRSGIEASLNALLRGRAASEELIHDGRHRPMEPLGPDALIASAGNTVTLTIDQNVQSIAEEALAAAVERHRADWATAVAMNPRNGEVLAMANFPSFDLNRHGNEPPENKSNHAIRSQIEPGSVMKIFTYAAAIEEGLLHEDEQIDCARGNWLDPFWHHFVRDDETHRLEVISAREAFAFSSNVAAVKIASRFAPIAEDPDTATRRDLVRLRRVGGERLMEHFRAFGFGHPSGVALRGEIGGIVNSPRDWGALDFRNVPIGQGIAVTALQMATALSAIADGGVWTPPQLVLKVEDDAGNAVPFDRPTGRRRVISTFTARRTLSLMETVVDEGTGTEAQIPGYRVGGKTGTADRYDEEVNDYRGHVASFAGVAPIDNPSVVCVVFVYNPRDGFYGGDVAAPAFREIVAECLRVQGVRTSDHGLQIADLPAPNPQPRRIHAALDMNLPGEGSWGSDRVPDLTGLTMREVVRELAEANVALRFEGTGRATSQVPPPGTALDQVSRVTVHFEDGPGHGG